LRPITKTVWRLAVVALVCLTAPVHPSWSGDRESEIEHLLGYIEHSECTFIRNDKPYSAALARNHLERKYSYAKTRVETADQFIKYVGTASSRSGKPYRIRCGEQEYTAGEWLTTELSRFRAAERSPGGTASGG